MRAKLGGQEVLDIQLRGEYAYTALGKGGFRFYDVAQIDNKDFSEKIVTAPVSPLGQKFYVKSKYATAIATPTTLGVDPLRSHDPQNEEQNIHLMDGLIDHRSTAFDRKRRFRVLAVAFVEFGDSEVEEFCLAVGPHQNVRRLQVAMDDVMGVRLRYSFQSIEEQPNARSDVESVLVAVSIDGFAINILQDEKGLAR